MTKKNDNKPNDDLSWLTFASPENPLQSTSLQIHFMDRRRPPGERPMTPELVEQLIEDVKGVAPHQVPVLGETRKEWWDRLIRDRKPDENISVALRAYTRRYVPTLDEEWQSRLRQVKYRFDFCKRTIWAKPGGGYDEEAAHAYRVKMEKVLRREMREHFSPQHIDDSTE
jgi:hypothetical protein